MSKSPWVKIADRKPDEGQEVFIKCKPASGLDYIYSRAEFYCGKFVGIHLCEADFPFSEIEVEAVTHWMPIPPLGEENE